MSGVPLIAPQWWWQTRTIKVTLIDDDLASFGRSIRAPREQVSVEPAGMVVPVGPTGLLVPWTLVDDVRPGDGDAETWRHPYWPSARIVAETAGEVR